MRKLNLVYTGPRRSTPENTVRNADVRIVTLLMQLAGYYNKHYCHPSQAKLCELLERFTGRCISRRQLNRHLNALQDQGYVHRQRRHRYDKHRGMVLCSTLYRIGARYLQQLRNAHRGLARFRDSLEKTAASIRVPRAAQYATNLLRSLVAQPGYPQARPPGTA
jgi:DNA-binding IclR family transcriptional regulator